MSRQRTLRHFVHAAAARAAALVRGHPEPEGQRRRITYLVVHAYATGGVPRAVFSVANELAERGHEVDVVSVYRTHPSPYMPVHPEVRVSFLEDRLDPSGLGPNVPRARRNPDRSLADRRLDRQPTVLAENAYPAFSALTDRLLRTRLESLPPGIVIATRPELAVAATRWAPADVITVDQEHLAFKARPKKIRRALAATSGVLDAVLTLTDADKKAWVRRLGPTSTLVASIPNASEFAVRDAAPLINKTVIAAGRLHHQKGFDHLIEAFAPVARAHPDWELHIYGSGRKEGDLRVQIDALELSDQIRLMGFTHDFEEKLSEASIYAMSSRYEGFPMVLLEAFSKGVPPVSFDCPQGPRQLINDGVNGLLVGRSDVPGMTDALLRLVEDEELRRRLGAGALESALSYRVDKVADRWEALFDELVERRKKDAARR